MVDIRHDERLHYVVEVGGVAIEGQEQPEVQQHLPRVRLVRDGELGNPERAHGDLVCQSSGALEQRLACAAATAGRRGRP